MDKSLLLDLEDFFISRNSNAPSLIQEELGPIEKFNKKGLNKNKTKKLFDSLFCDIVHTEESELQRTELRKEYFSIYKNLILAKIFLQNWNYDISYKITNLAIESCRKFHIREQLPELLSVKLRIEHVLNLKERKNTLIQLKQELINYHNERNIEADIMDLFKIIEQNNLISKKAGNLASNLLGKYSKFKDQNNSLHFQYHLHRISLIDAYYSKNYNSILAVAENADLYFSNQKAPFRPGILTFKYIKIEVYIFQFNFKKVDILIEKLLKDTPKYSMHFLRIKECYIISKFFEKKYSECVKEFFNLKKVIEKFRKTRAESRWKLIEAYIFILLESGQAKHPQGKKRFSVPKLINEVTPFIKDKMVMNIPILVAQMSFHIIRKEYEKAFDRIEALSKYSTRYLKRNETFRSNCFIKMLIEIPKNNFNKLRVERHTKKLREKLSSLSIEDSHQPFYMEIIPYENLWEIIMDSLDAKTQYSVQK